MNKKTLYIITFEDSFGYNMPFYYQWSTGDKHQAWKEWAKAMQLGLPYNDVRIEPITEAVHRQDVLDSVTRHLIKPLNK